MMVDSQLILVKIKMYSRELAFFFFLLAVCKPVPNDHVDRAVVTKPTVSLVEGTRGVLTCHYPYPVYFVAWNKGSTLEETTNILIMDMLSNKVEIDGPGFREGRFNITDDFSLVIYNVKPDDEGRYSCKVADKETDVLFYSYTDVTVSGKPFMKIAHCPPRYPTMDTVQPEYDDCIFKLTANEKEVHLNCSLVFPKQSEVDISLTWVKGENNEHVKTTGTTYRRDDKHTCEMSVTMMETMDESQSDQTFSCIARGKTVFGGIVATAYVQRFVDVTLPMYTDKPIEIFTTTYPSESKQNRVLYLVVIIVVFLFFGDRVRLLVLRKQTQNNGIEEEQVLLIDASEELQGDLKEWATTPSDFVKLRQVEDKWDFPPFTITKKFHQITSQYQTNVAMALRKGNSWEKLNYSEYWNKSRSFAKSIIELRLNVEQDRRLTVGIIGCNSPEWIFSYMGTIAAGGVTVGVSDQCVPEELWAIIDDCKPDVIVVGDQDQFNVLRSGLDKRPHIKAVITYTGGYNESGNFVTVYTWQQFLEKGKDRSDDELDKIEANLKPNQCCVIAYTNGHSTNVKGCMFCHDNITWLANIMIRHLKLSVGSGAIISYGPLSHISSQIMNIYLPLFTAATTYFPNEPITEDTYSDMVLKVRPTLAVIHIRLLEKMRVIIEEKLSSYSPPMKFLNHRATDIGIRAADKISKGEYMPWGWTLANLLVFRKVRRELGLDRCDYVFTWGEPLQRDLVTFFMTYNIPLLEVYSMTESTGPLSACVPNRIEVGSVGIRFPGFHINIVNPDTQWTGEICLTGRNLFIGYLNKPEKTQEALNDNGWFRSGDVGYLDSDGYLYIKGTLRDFIKTTEGKKINSVPIESTVKGTTGLIGDCILIGHGRDYLTMLITLKQSKDKGTGVPSGYLADEAQAILRQAGCNVQTAMEAKNDDVVKGLIDDAIAEYNKIARFEWLQIKKWTILEKDFSAATGELRRNQTPVPIEKFRNVIKQKYSSEINSMYP